MKSYTDDIENDARDIIKQFSAAAADIAHLRAEIAEKNIRNPRLAQMWRAIAEAIERLRPKS
jgi:hypothetical protein